jgi:Fe-S-cluster-containing hydrogenase component 2
MSVRKIVVIDEEKCNGCGVCVPGCHEGAIQIFEGKARLVADNLCDGLGDCLKECPLDAIRIIEREAEEFDEEAVEARLISLGRKSPVQTAPAPTGCPGSRAISFSRLQDSDESQGKVASQLTQWPVQLHLVSPQASYFQDAHLLIAADCVPFAFPEFHRELLKGKALAIACPKLDDTTNYVAKLTQILTNNIQSVTVAHMEVPCCTGLAYMVKEALQKSGSTADFREVTITIQGDIR